MELKSSRDQTFDSIYQAHKNSILKVAMHFLKDLDSAEEITQRVFLQLYEHFEDVSQDTIHSWLVTTTKHMALNYKRKRKHEVSESFFDWTEELIGRLSFGEELETNYLHHVGDRKARQLEQTIFERLYREHRDWYDVVVLFYCFDKSQKKAAEELDITVEVFNSRLYRARQWIRKHYEKEYREILEWF